MFRVPSSARLPARALFLSCLLAALPVAAAQFSLNPTRVHLDRALPVETLVIGNEEARPIAFEITVKRWTQGADGEWVLVPSDGLIVHPLILSVPAGAKARFRVGTLTPDVAAEQAYRVELRQLRDPAAQGANQVAVLTKVSLPVLVRPPGTAPAPRLATARMERGALHLRLRNEGTGYLAPLHATLRLRDAAGRLLHEDQVAIGYVLAGAELPLKRPAPAGLCGRATRVELLLEGNQAPLQAQLAPAPCAR